MTVSQSSAIRLVAEEKLRERIVSYAIFSFKLQVAWLVGDRD